jgi:DNA gyrase/topoisomerase IV subunit B
VILAFLAMVFGVRADEPSFPAPQSMVIFSKVFIGTTDDGKHKCKVSCKDNMHEIKTKLLESSGRSGTTVYFEPDLARFSLQEITQQHFDLIYQRLINLSISFPELKFYFNGEKLNININL